MKFIRAWIPVLLLVVCLMFTACTGEQAGMEKYDSNGSFTAEISQESEADIGSVSDRKVTIEDSFSVTVENVTKAAADLEAAAKKLEGYVEFSEIETEKDNGSSGYAQYTLRIPADSLDAFSADLAKLGKIENRTHNENDITDSYYDVAARVKALQTQLNRLNQLSAQAKNLNDLLKLETEISRVQSELDSLTGQQKHYDNQVTYATVTVNLSQTVVTAAANTSFIEDVKEAVRDAFITAREIGKGILIVLIWLLPYLLVAGLVLFIVLFCTRKKRAAKKAYRKAMRQQRMQQITMQPTVQEVPAPIPAPVPVAEAPVENFAEEPVPETESHEPALPDLPDDTFQL